MVQLRKDNAQGTIYNIVGFQTHLKLAGAEAGVLHDPRPEKRRVCALRGDAPEHLSGLPPAAGPVLPGAGAASA